ncbi:N-acetylmuramoyl-L-alanine amidase, partial [archaeon]|nr:N-acetylmuramoyl-L-alanine amidase [archaeon]
MLKIERIEGLISKGNHSKKRQLILTHTQRNLRDYIVGLKNRLNGEYTYFPHFIIDREGVIYQLMDTNSYSEYMDVSSVNKNSVIISLENLGWLRKNPLTSYYVNWIGEIHKERIYERKWRGHHFWQPYSEKQYKALSELVIELCDIYEIPRLNIGHNVIVEKIENFKGIVAKSNYDREYTD